MGRYSFFKKEPIHTWLLIVVVIVCIGSLIVWWRLGVNYKTTHKTNPNQKVAYSTNHGVKS